MIKYNKNKNKSGNFDPNGNYTGKYIKEWGENATVLTSPEQDADDL